jgi:hypothetical protein
VDALRTFADEYHKFQFTRNFLERARNKLAHVACVGLLKRRCNETVNFIHAASSKRLQKSFRSVQRLRMCKTHRPYHQRNFELLRTEFVRISLRGSSISAVPSKESTVQIILMIVLFLPWSLGFDSFSLAARSTSKVRYGCYRGYFNCGGKLSLP